MSIRVAELFADLALRSTGFREGMAQSVRIAEQAGTSMTRAFGTGPQTALNSLATAAQRAASSSQQALGGVGRAMTELQGIADATGRSIQQSVGGGAAGAAARTAEAGNSMSATFHRMWAAAEGTGNTVAHQLGPRIRRELDATEEATERLTWNMRGYFKDVGRVITGILISQGFYKLLSTIEEAIQAVARFSVEMEQAAVSFSILLGNQDEADAFITVLERFAAVTPFTVESARDASQRLLAMGFAAEEIIPTMRTLSDATAVFGANKEKLDRIVLALGQMKTNGIIAGQELRQLAEAGIPAYTILRQELGLTLEQVRKIREQGISGEIGVEAILQGMERRYKGAADRISQTAGGLLSTIKDNLLIISQTGVASIFDSFKGTLKGIADSLNILRDAMGAAGTRGIFEYLIPPELRQSVLVIWSALSGLVQAVRNLYNALKPTIVALGSVFLRALALLLPIITGLVLWISRLALWIGQCTPLVHALVIAITSLLVSATVTVAISALALAIQALGIAGKIAIVVRVLGVAIRFLIAAFTMHPIVALITLLATALVGLALTSSSVSNWLDSVTQKIMNLMGLQATVFENPEQSEGYKKALAKYNAGLEETKKKFKDLAQAAKDSAKKIKDTFIASFDEVFAVPDKLDEIGEGFDIIEPPDFVWNPEETKKVKEDLQDVGDLWDWLKKKLSEVPLLFTMDIQFPNFPNLPLIGAVVTTLLQTIETIIARIKAQDPVEVLVTVFDGATEILAEIANRVASLAQEAIIYISTEVVAPGLQFLMDSLTWLQEISPVAIIVDMVTDLATLTTQIRDLFQECMQLAGLVLTITAVFVYNLALDGLKSFGQSISDFFTITVPEMFRNFVAWVETNWKELLIGALIAVATTIIFIFGGEIVAGLAGLGAIIITALEGVVASITAAFAAGGIFAGATTTVATWVAGILALFGLIKTGAVEANASAQAPTITRRVSGAPFNPAYIESDFYSFRKMAPGFASGGVVSKEMFANIGENNKREAIVPLEGSSAVRSFARAIVAELRGGQAQAATQVNNYSIGTLIGDERSLTILERKLGTIRTREDFRKGGA